MIRVSKNFSRGCGKPVFLLFAIVTILHVPVFSQQKVSNQTSHPRLVVGIVVDQMRWDYLYRYASRYGEGGFKRLLGEGFSCENTMIPYIPTITACGHTCVYTGSVPAVHGIVGNDWYSRELNRNMYCAEDTSVSTIGSSSAAGKMSPRNMLVTTIGDELNLATNFQSKIVGVAIKDRGSILPAGHSATAAYWYDGSAGKIITSSYYMNALPDWVNTFNDKKLPQEYLSKPWNTMYPLGTYKESSEDDELYEGRFEGETSSRFPHDFTGYKNRSEMLASTPFGNTYTLEFAKQAVENYSLGKGSVTDMLCVSLSSTDYVGHRFGPNSIEAEDTYLRLDKDLSSFFQYLDKTIGKGQYTVFLTADHGVEHVSGFLKQHKIPGGNLDERKVGKTVDSLIQQEFGIKKALLAGDNYQIYFNYKAIEDAGKTLEEVKHFTEKELMKMPDIINVIDLENLAAKTLNEPLKTMMTNGYNAKRSGDLQLVLLPDYMSGSLQTGTTHGVYYSYDAHIPLVWMGWGIQHGKTNTVTYMTDIASTVAALLQIQMPSGCVGKPITDITNHK